MKHKKTIAAIIAAVTLLLSGCDIDKIADDLDAKIGASPFKDKTYDIANSITDEFEDAMSNITNETWAGYSALK